MNVKPATPEERAEFNRAYCLAYDCSTVFFSSESPYFESMFAMWLREHRKVQEVQAKADALQLQAECHAQEARTANATINEIYQALTGATGEPGNWDGAEPARKVMAELKALQVELEALKQNILAQWARNMSTPDNQTPFEFIKHRCKSDPEYAWSWHCNITMPIYDSGIHLASANHAAAAVMRSLFDVEPAHALPPIDAHPAPSIPEGWKMVPIKPTEKMIDAFFPGGRVLSGYVGAKEKADARFADGYRAMLAAAPEPPK